MPNKVDILRKVDLLSEQNDQELNELADDFQWQEYPQGSYVIQEGEDCPGFFVLIEGTAEVFIYRKSYAPLQLNSFGPGDAFGEMDLFAGKPCSATVRCLENCRLLVLNRERFAYMLVRWPKLYDRFINKLSQRLGQASISQWEAGHKEFLRSSLQINQLKYKSYEFWGSSLTLKHLDNNLEGMASYPGPVLLIGERGTGKLMTAWFFHKQQFGEDSPFIIMDGRHLDQEWGDSLFDKPEGAGSLSQGKGHCLLDIAEGGTLFIRDINLISPVAQLKLANVLQAQKSPCHIIGSLVAEPEVLSVRLVSELRRCLTKVYRIAPLRERKKDIPIIANKLFEKLAQQHQRKTPRLDQEAIKLLLTHNYNQGNVTELIQIIERAFYLAEGEVIGLEHLFFGPTGDKAGYTFNLLSWNWLYQLIRNGKFPLLFQRISFVVMLLTIVIFLFVPNSTIAAYGLTLVWGLWWPMIVIAAFSLGRVWCGACPVSYTMELAQKVFHLNLPVPNILKKHDYLFSTFLFLLVFWIEAVTDMQYNNFYAGLWLLTIAGSATITGIIFTRHTWCRHLCPLGGFIGIASISGMVEVRADSEICLNNCNTHECYRGSGDIEGCPMSQYAAYLDSNQACKLCLRCVRNCPNDAVKLNLRMPAREIWHLVRVNQGFAVFIGVALAILIPIMYFEPFHKVWPHWQWILWYSLAYWGTALSAGAVTWLVARPFSTKAASTRIKLVFALIPLVVAGFTAYQLHFLPGANTILVGLGYNSHGTQHEILYVPIQRIGQTVAAFLGMLLTGVAIVMVLSTKKKKLTAETKGPQA